MLAAGFTSSRLRAMPEEAGFARHACYTVTTEQPDRHIRTSFPFTPEDCENGYIYAFRANLRLGKAFSFFTVLTSFLLACGSVASAGGAGR